MSRPLLALLMIALLAVTASRSVFEAVVPPPPPPGLEATPPALEPLTRHVFFVVVDGLRYDVATDPERMPFFSRAMREHTSGEIWCGRISMTTSAVMAYGTGQRGQLEQILRNVSPGRPPYASWLEDAKQRGLSLMSVGDPAWSQMYGREFEKSLLDPKGVAIDVDFNAQTFRDIRTLRDAKPNFLVGHFVTPDHQGHAYGIPSQRYARHIHGFDRDLAALLAEFGPEWTVVVTSDHGAADSGTHGTDTPVQRRSPIYAYGPGIAAGVHPAQRLDQVDLAGTLAALLGVAAPTHGVGHVLVDWLAISPAERARIACNDVARAVAYGSARIGAAALERARSEAAICGTATDPERKIAAAKSAALVVDRELGASTGLGSRTAWLLVALSLLVALAAAVVVQGRVVLGRLPAAIALSVGALLLVLWVERLPGSWPNVVRALLFTLGNLGLLALLVRPANVAGFLERHAKLAPLLLPGLLVVTYTSNTQPQSYVLVVVGSLFLLRSGALDESSTPPFGDLRRAAWPVIGLAVIALLALAPAGLLKNELYPSLLYERADLALAAALALVVIWALAQLKDQKKALPVAIVLVSVAGSLLLRRVAPPLLGRLSIVVFAAAAIWAVVRRERLLGLGFGVASYAWVSRDLEFLAFIPALGLADLLARRARLTPEPGARGLPQLLLLVGVVFALLYVQRVGLQGSLDIGAMDWGAGGFKDPHVPAWLVGSAIAYKYVSAELLVVAVVTAALAAPARPRFLQALTLTYLARTAVMLAMLFVCGESFWTALRVLGDLPFGLTGAAAVVLVWIGVASLQLDSVRFRSPALPE